LSTAFWSNKAAMMSICKRLSSEKKKEARSVVLEVSQWVLFTSHTYVEMREEEFPDQV
jgi:hypothetical protein